MEETDFNELDQVCQESFDLLEKILEEASSLSSEGDYRGAFIFRHARNIYYLGRDVVFLLESGRLNSCPFVVRGMLESLFKLVASVKRSDVAMQILLSEVEADIDRMKRFNPIGCAPGIKVSLDFASKLRKEHNITSKKKWNTLECAEAADLVEKYRGDYFVLSGSAHASTGGIIMQENQIGASHSLQTLLFIVIYAAAELVQAIQTKTPQAHLDQSTRLAQRLTGLVKCGMFIELSSDSNGEQSS